MTATGSAHDLAAWLLAQVESALAECDRAPINRAYVAAGGIAWDDCCGMLVVAPERVYKSATFPQQDSTEELCWGGFLTVDLLVLLVRCIPVVDDRGRAPTAAALQAAYLELIEDAAVVYNAVTASLPNPEWMRALPTQSFVGAEGGCIGVETRLTLGVQQDEWALCCVETVPYVPGEPICTVPAGAVTFEPCDSLTSSNVQDAICELAERPVDVDAADVGFEPCGGLTATNVQDAICEVLERPVDLDASDIRFEACDGLESTNVQDAICEVSGLIGVPRPFITTFGTVSGTQPVFNGAPKITGQYMLIGDLVHFEIQATFSNVTNFGTGQYFLTLPFAPNATIVIRNGNLTDASNGRQYALSGHASAVNSRLTLSFSGSNGHDEPFEHDSPFVLATADDLHILGSYLRVNASTLRDATLWVDAQQS